MSAKESGGGFYLYGKNSGILAKNTTFPQEKKRAGKDMLPETVLSVTFTLKRV